MSDSLNFDNDAIYVLIRQEIEEEHNDLDYQQYITMCAPKMAKLPSLIFRRGIPNESEQVLVDIVNKINEIVEELNKLKHLTTRYK